MKKIIFMRILMLSIFLLAGCNEESELQSLENMPTRDDILEFYNTHTQEESDALMREVMVRIDNTSYEEICNILDASLQEWKETQAPFEVNQITTEYSRDELLMNAQANEKMFSNIFLNVGIHYDPEKVIGSEQELFDTIFDYIQNALMKTPYGMKINELELSLYRNDAPRYIGKVGFARIDSIDLPQPKEELHIQTIAYNFVEAFNRTEFSDERFSRHGNATLNRFGIKSDTDELYIEIPIYEVDYNKDVEALKKSLKGRSNDLYDLIIANTEAASYLEDNNVKILTVAFYAPWDNQSYHTYTYNLEALE